MIKIPPWLGLVLACAFNTLTVLGLANVFPSGSKGALAVTIINATLFNALALLGVPIVNGKAAPPPLSGPDVPK